MTLKRLTRKPVPASVLRRDPAAGDVSPSGRLKTNANSHDDMDNLAVAKGLDQEKYAVTLGYDHDKRLIYVYPDHPTALGAVALTRPSLNVYSFSIATIFDDDPSLRVTTRRACSFSSGTDTDGLPCMVLALDSSVQKRSASRQTTAQ